MDIETANSRIYSHASDIRNRANDIKKEARKLFAIGKLTPTQTHIYIFEADQVIKEVGALEKISARLKKINDEKISG